MGLVRVWWEEEGADLIQGRERSLGKVCGKSTRTQPGTREDSKQQTRWSWARQDPWWVWSPESSSDWETRQGQGRLIISRQGFFIICFGEMILYIKLTTFLEL